MTPLYLQVQRTVDAVLGATVLPVAQSVTGKVGVAVGVGCEGCVRSAPSRLACSHRPPPGVSPSPSASARTLSRSPPASQVLAVEAQVASLVSSSGASISVAAGAAGLVGVYVLWGALSLSGVATLVSGAVATRDALQSAFGSAPAAVKRD